MKKKLIALGLSGLMVCGSAMANVTVVSTYSCGEWVKFRGEKGMPKVAVEKWLLGYLSGIAYGTEVDALQKTEVESLFLWTDNYCRANPLKHTHQAGNELFQELAKRK